MLTARAGHPAAAAVVIIAGDVLAAIRAAGPIGVIGTAGTVTRTGSGQGTAARAGVVIRALRKAPVTGAADQSLPATPFQNAAADGATGSAGGDAVAVLTCLSSRADHPTGAAVVVVRGQMDALTATTRLGRLAALGDEAKVAVTLDDAELAWELTQRALLTDEAAVLPIGVRLEVHVAGILGALLLGLLLVVPASLLLVLAKHPVVMPIEQQANDGGTRNSPSLTTRRCLEESPVRCVEPVVHCRRRPFLSGARAATSDGTGRPRPTAHPTGDEGNMHGTPVPFVVLNERRLPLHEKSVS